MGDSLFLSILVVFFVVWIFFLWISARKAKSFKPSTHLQYLWRLKEISGKSEYELFEIAAKEKGWPAYHVEGHFNQYLKDQTLPEYVKEFLEDGKEHIQGYSGGGGKVFEKNLVVFYAILGLILLGGVLVVSLWLLPRF